MSEKIFNTRIQLKHDTEANWGKAINFIPKAGEIIIYDTDENYNYARLKSGDGVTAINSLSFSTAGALQSDWEQHNNFAIDYIKNRTHYDSRVEEIKEATFDGTLNGKQFFELGDGQYLVKISEDAPLSDNLIGMEGTIYNYGELITTTIEASMIQAMTPEVFMVADILVVALEDTDVEGLPLTKGCWSMMVIENEISVMYGTSLNYKIFSGELKTLEVKYLPEESIITTKEINQICFGDLESNSWENIKKLSEAGIAKNCWSIGDCKAIHLQGTVGTLALDQTLYLFILGFDHNAEKEGYGITFGGFKTAAGADGIDVSLVDSYYNQWLTDGTITYNMHHWGYANYGGWARSDIRYDILGSTNVAPQGYGAKAVEGQVGYDATATCVSAPVANTLMSCLPADLRAVMKPITKWTDNVGGGIGHVEANVSASIDYLPLLAEYEIFGSLFWSNEYEQNHQQQYEYYAAGNSRIKYLHSNTEEAAWWWERSPCYSGTASFCRVAGDGDADNDGADLSRGIAPALLV